MPSSGDCVNRLARFHREDVKQGRQSGGSAGWNENIHLAPSEQTLLQKPSRPHLTPTGLLMEGVYTHGLFL